MAVIELLAAYLLDVLIGDPVWLPHPVRGVGLMIAGGERLTRRLIRNERLAGTLLVLAVISVTGAIVWGTVWWAERFGGPWCRSVVTVLWLYLGLSTRSLSDHVLRVDRHLRAGDLPSARKSVGCIVGRDTAKLDAGEVSRAAIESTAESAVDGILSPFFFIALGGAPLLWVFKTVSTCDSMIGYKNERYMRFGTFGARLDDVLNFIPARLGYPIFTAAALLTGNAAGSAWRIAWRDHHHHASPNAGIPEAAMAGALRIRLGGPTVYEGETEAKPYFGAEFRPPEPVDIRRAVNMMWTVSLLGCLMCVGGLYLCQKLHVCLIR